ncbi:MAG: CRISPR system precrRNA processing endoribonuclease RAMP protein Cas6 [Desulfuromonadaceae bacterium]|nr:CRISPR system precrRNA processing endoribonuclease RAMP protein Cas6 [Desulfuromonadaceae bacterium]
MDLDFVRIECEVGSDIPAQLTASLYDSLRNFELHFKALCCLNQQEPCTSCNLHAGCPYQIVFGQELSSDPEIVRLHQKPSLPFSLYINGIDGNTTSCIVGMVVIGRAVNYIGFFHTALLRMVEAAVYTVLPPAKVSLRSYSLDYQGVRHEITHAASLPESVILLSGLHILQNTVHSDSVILSLKSPLRLLSNGSIAHRYDFGMFFRAQLRRCSSLCAYYGAGELDLDFTRLSDSAQNVAILDDKTRYTQPLWSKRLNRAGLTGTVECSGLVEPMLSLLLLGSFFNAGKGTTFGLGFHQIESL